MNASVIKTLRVLFLPFVCTVFLIAHFHQSQPYLQPSTKITITNDSVQATVPVGISRTLTPTGKRTSYTRQLHVDNSFMNGSTSATVKDFPFQHYDPVNPPLFILKNDTKKYFVNFSHGTCFLRGTNLSSSNRTCVCLPRWSGSDCSVPEAVLASQKFKRKYTNKSIKRRSSPRRVINALNINHEMDMLEIRVHELNDVVDVFVICESNYTAYGEPKPLYLLRNLRNGFLKEFQHKIVYVWLDHFPEGGKEDGWIADSYLRTFLWKQGKTQLSGLRDDDLFILTDADEIPRAEVVAFLKNHDGFGEPISWRLRWHVFGFFWLNFMEHVEVSAACTIKYLREALKDDAINVRSGKLPKDAQPWQRAMMDEWTIGQNRGQNGGWHCSWCYKTEDVKIKLVSAQKSDGTRWGDFPEKMETKYLLSLVKEGRWFNGKKIGLRSHVDSTTTPAYVLAHPDKFSYMLAPPGEVFMKRS
ncbi:beta-1,4-mannosyl-glycoprotein 4-beta-N-acetylglucosaminyltransferase-like [Ornithodoros turicata]|uniref:beta-1,4-mannosyl-glycoprotein 4-beta-N-acetylglucosaminyltransferase-like n=1 Tax=Ornithodoros turicata TaxID=34597 RepID=UPI0031393E9A